MLDVNVLGIVRTSRAALPALRRSSAAAIVNIGSIAATAGLPQRALYSATKGAVLALTRAMAADHLRGGHPGQLRQPRHRRHPVGRAPARARRRPRRRAGRPRGAPAARPARLGRRGGRRRRLPGEPGGRVDDRHGHRRRRRDAGPAPAAPHVTGAIDAVLGVDIGTSSSKGVLVDLERPRAAQPGRRARRAAARAPVTSRWTAGLVATSSPACRASCSTAPTPGWSRSGSAAWARACCSPTPTTSRVRPAILYGVDTRSGAQIAAAGRRAGRAGGAPPLRLGAVLAGGRPEDRLDRRARSRELFARARRLFMPSSWLVRRLTGAYVLDHHSASQCTPLYDTQAQRWYAPVVRARGAGPRAARSCAGRGRPPGTVTRRGGRARPVCRRASRSSPGPSTPGRRRSASARRASAT